jgi:AcrR family transcriptional regulator
MADRRSAPPEGAALDGVGPDGNGFGRAPWDAGGRPDGHARSGASRQVAELQRARMLTAMVQEISERGAANVSVAHVVGRSGVSRRTFYELFEDREDCFLAAFDEALRGVTAAVVPAYEAPGAWRVKLRAGLVALLECLECDRATGRLLIAESLAAGPRALERRRNVIARIIAVVERGSGEGRGAGEQPPGLTAEGIVGGVLSVLHARLAEDDPTSLLDLTGPLMGMIVLPYLGPAAARREIEQAAPERSGRPPVVRADPLQDLPMRLTYRTMRVLTSIAELSANGTCPSNRAVGEHAGIGDQGQASKLLARLHKLGLIENRGGDLARGEPNAWVLTPIGRQVHESIAGLGG